MGYLSADNNWKYVVKIYPRRDFKDMKTFVKYMNSDYNTRYKKKFKYVLVPRFEDGKYYLYGVTTDVEPCETKNSVIEIIDEYVVGMASEISDCVFESQKLAVEERNLFKCSMFFLYSLGLNGKPEKLSGYYCYEWYDVDTDYVFYVGKGTGSRWKQLKPDRRNDDFIEYYNNHNCSCRFVKTNMSEEGAYSAEKERLKYLHEIGQAHCNHDGGGRCGATNYGAYNGMYHNTHSNEVRKRLSEINKACQGRGKNGNAKPVYVYTEEKVFLKKYECVPDAIDELFNDIENESKFRSLRSAIYKAMNETKRPVRGYYFSREKIS